MIWLWIALAFVLGGIVVALVIYNEFRKGMDKEFGY